MSSRDSRIPRLPVFGWAAWTGAAAAPASSLMELPHVNYSTSGRASILLALESLGVGPGQKVLLPTYHCPTMVAPVVHRGALPVFYPIDETGAPKLNWLDQQDLADVRVLLVAHFFGLPQPLADVRRWCDAKGIALIEDCAHALFGRCGDRAIGAWGDMAIGSLTKFLPVPEGGCLVVNNGSQPPALERCSFQHQIKAALDILEEGARHRRLFGLNTVLTSPLATWRSLRKRRSEERATDSQPLPSPNGTVALDGIDTTLARRQLSAPSRWIAQHLPRERIVARRRQRYVELSQRLSDRTGLRPLLPHLPPDCAPYVFPLWVDSPDPGYAELRRLLTPVFRWDRLWPNVPAISGDFGRPWSHHVLQLACHQDLANAEMERMLEALLRLYDRSDSLAPSSGTPGERASPVASSSETMGASPRRL